MIVKVRDSLIDMMLHLLGFYVMHGSVCSSRFGGAMVCLRWSGSYVTIPRAGELVVYFPQGHLEQVL
jgi:hypothetical protein